jgi:hypothetical protein
MREFGKALREVAKTLPAPQASLPILPPASRAPTIPPPGEPAWRRLPWPQRRRRLRSGTASPCRPAFDSLAGTMRLAALTDAKIDATRIARPPAPPEPELEPTKPAAPPAPVVSDVGDTLAVPAPPESFPLLPAAILGALAFVAIVLGIAIACRQARMSVDSTVTSLRTFVGSVVCIDLVGYSKLPWIARSR